MQNGLSSIYIEPKDWEEWIIATFDPTFDSAPRFFAGWDTNDDEAIMALMVRQEHGYDKAQRMTKDEAENEIMLVQSCVGPEIFVYLMPYLPRQAKSLADITPKAAQMPMKDDFQPLAVTTVVTKYTRFIEDPVMVMLALCFATLTAYVVLI